MRAWKTHRSLESVGAMGLKMSVAPFLLIHKAQSERRNFVGHSLIK
jgi:hypothetical protein